MVCRQLGDSLETMLYRPLILESVTDQGPQPCALKPIKVCRVKGRPLHGLLGTAGSKDAKVGHSARQGMPLQLTTVVWGLPNGLLSLPLTAWQSRTLLPNLPSLSPPLGTRLARWSDCPPSLTRLSLHFLSHRGFSFLSLSHFNPNLTSGSWRT